ncbi:hypothetical protein B0J13DRAFT_434783 [Dactylonectria estremocensis]|uniref:FAD-binding domain-containing protein n=1 Tax=Dactylonectria estremocensis TaxID=1079267 RepID=A0A9P9FBZ0_9HYPO|nr:hypothetical protein B0J13DRAFT_434783 [Dactylonectria estremocensis]
MTCTHFRAIIVGGGPVGLTAAHALSRAGVDFLLLERRPNMVVDAGSNLVLLPMALRTLYQLGLRSVLESVSSPLGTINRIDHHGRPLGDMKWFELDMENFGAHPRVISRHQLTKSLYEGLPSDAEPKMLPNKKVSGINKTSDGVLVNCADGTAYAGSIVIAADGAHSLIRDCMRNLALEADSLDVNDEKPFLTTYRALWIRFPTSISSGLQVGTTCETHGRNLATQLFAGEDTAVIGVYERLDKPTRERIRFTESDQDDLIERWGDLPLLQDGQLSLRHAYKAKMQSGLVSLEEGVVQHWSWDGRVVLAGDAAHKFTPSTAAGCNNGIIDVVALANELHSAIEQARASSQDPEASPTRLQLASAFQTYQDARYLAVTAGRKLAGNVTAMATWQTEVHKFLDRRVFSFQSLQRLMARHASSRIAQTPVFDFFDSEEHMAGKVPWSVPITPKVN